MDAFEKLASFQPFMAFEDEEEKAIPPVGCPMTEGGSIPGRHIAKMLEEGTKEICSPEENLPISHATLPNGRKVPLLKTVLTSACERNCYYCAFRAGRDFRRSTFQPEELAKTFLSVYQRGIVEGMFLSSGVAGGGIRTQDRLIATAEVLREKLGYRGFLHLKIMPGAEKAQVERAMQLADRVSVNLEAPTSARLGQLAPQKMLLEELLQPLRWVEEIRQSLPGWEGWDGHWPSSTTQFVVGAVGETDLELLRATEYLYRKLRLARAYYSGFNPVSDTPLEGHNPVNPWRTHRLYQASFLLRDYGFEYEELPFSGAGSLPLETDPKLAWARLHLLEAPLEINRIGLQELIRIPGIGPRGARAILEARRKSRLVRLEDLQALGVHAHRAAPFVLLAGKRPAFQLHLF